MDKKQKKKQKMKGGTGGGGGKAAAQAGHGPGGEEGSSSSDTALFRNKLVLTMECYLKERLDVLGPTNAVAVSLSGGVDSMVVAELLCVLRRKSPAVFGSLKIICVHIDYANRQESAAEAAYVEGWCDRRGIVFFKRVVDEVTRGVTARDEYEAISRCVSLSLSLSLYFALNSLFLP